MSGKGSQRTIIRSLRFTAEEWGLVYTKLAGRDFSAVTRSMLLGQTIPEPRRLIKREIVRRRMTEAEAHKIRHAAWIGNNLNQIARATNQGIGAPQLLAALLSLEREIRRSIDAP